MREVDLLIVGQGLAGTTLAWEAFRRDLSFAVIDDGKTATASRIAAGLVTPISGQRLTLLPDFRDYWNDAEVLYRHIERQLHERFWHPQTALRVWKSDREVQKYSDSLERNHGSFLGERFPPHTFPKLSDPWGSFEMLSSSRLDVSRLLELSRQLWRHSNQLIEMEFANNQLDSSARWMELQNAQVRARHLVLCTGASACEGLESVHERCLRPNQGDILRIRCPELGEVRTVHAEVWIAPIAKNEYFVGATYRWENDFSSEPRTVDRDLLIERCSAVLRVPFEVVEHQTALRPASFDQRPVLGCLSSNNCIAVLNGLGSRGSLQAPRCARLLLDFLFEGKSIPNELRWDRPFQSSRKS